MASIEEALVAKLLAADGVAALVDTRVYPLVAPEGAGFPLLVYQVISETHLEGLEGSVGCAAARVQIVAWALREAEAAALGEALRMALQGYAGTVAVGAESVRIGCISLEDRGDMFEPSSGLRANRRFGKRLDFRVSYFEPIPS